MHIKTITANTARSLDRRVNAFLERHDVNVQGIHASTSFGTYMIVVEYDER